MNRQSHGLRSEQLRENSYFAEIDQILLANLRETLELQREAEQCASAGRREKNSSPRILAEAGRSPAARV